MQTKSAATLRLPDLSASSLHILAMGLMLLDHLWATIVPGQDWMTCGRTAGLPHLRLPAGGGVCPYQQFPPLCQPAALLGCGIRDPL